MENSVELPFSSITSTLPLVSPNGSMSNDVHVHGGYETGLNLETISLRKLSRNLGQLLCETGSDFSDADILVEDRSIGVHRCILASRSTFFDNLFREDKGSVGKEGKPQYYMKHFLPKGNIGFEAFVVFLSYLYTGKLRPSPPEVSTCIDNTCAHEACRPAIDFAVGLMYASTFFHVAELASLFQRRLLSLASKAIIEDVIPILLAAFDCQLRQLLAQCVEKVALSDFETIAIEKELPPNIAENIKLLRLNSIPEQENGVTPVDPMHEKQIKSIHKALDTHDIELVRRILTESDVSLDDAYALHYAIAYCNLEIVKELLSLGLADVNLPNTRGNTVLHVAARRKEPSIIVSLLTKGASASDLTLEGQSALSICKRLTRPKDYQMKRENGQEANKDRICIDVLDGEMHRNPVAGDAYNLSLAMVDNLHMKYICLENRVAFARIFFPTEAKLAMEIAHAETTSGLAGFLSYSGSFGIFVEEATDVTQERLLAEIETLSVTVELGRRYFPHCSEVLDKIMEDDVSESFETGTHEEQRMKRMRFMELKGEVDKAFTKDKAELHRSGFSALSSSSSSPSFKVRSNKGRKFPKGKSCLEY